MDVTIIGSGNMARGIGMRLASGGHTITIHARDKAKGWCLADQLRSADSGAEISVGPIGGKTDAIVILATPYGEAANIAKEYGGLKGKTVIDISNPVNFETFQLIPEPCQSGAQEIARLLPKATVIKAFNTTLSGALAAGKIDGKALDVFIAGDNEDAKADVRRLIKMSGMRPIDVGSLENSRHLEGFGLIQMQIQDQIGTKWMSALKFLGQRPQCQA